MNEPRMTFRSDTIYEVHFCDKGWTDHWTGDKCVAEFGCESIPADGGTHTVFGELNCLVRPSHRYSMQ